MREEYEDTGMNPLKVGIIGAVVVAVLLAGVLQFRSYTERKAAMQQEQVSLQDSLTKAKKENKDLQKKLADLQDESKSMQSRLEKMLKLKDSQIVSAAREKDTSSRNAEAKIGQLTRENDQLEVQVAQMKKDADQRAQEMKKVQDQLAKLQSDLKTARAETDRYAKDVKALQAKLNNISAGDDAAADQMVQQLSEARQKLKQEQVARQKLQQELDSLKQAQAPQ